MNRIGLALAFCLCAAAFVLGSARAGNPECFTSGILGDELVCAAVSQPAAELVSGTLTSSAGSTSLSGPVIPLRRMEGTGTSGIACVSWGKRHDCFVRATDGTLYTRALLETGALSDWRGLGAPPGGISGEPGCVAVSSNRADCFVMATQGSAMWHIAWDGARWRRWVNLGGDLIAPPRCYSRGSRSIDCVARFRGGALMHVVWNGADWGPWRTVASSVRGQPDCVKFSAAELRCYVIDGGGRFTQWILNGDSWVAGEPPPHPARAFVPFRGDVDCAADSGAKRVVCAWNSVFFGAPVVIASKLELSKWTEFKTVSLSAADRLSCTASGTMPTQFICGFTAPGGGAFRVLHWTGRNASAEPPYPMTDWGVITFPELVRTSF